MCPFTWHFRKGKTIRVKNRLVFARDGGWGEGSACKNEMGGVTKLFHISLVVSRLQDYIYLLTHIEQYSLKWGILLGANYTSINLIFFFLKKECLSSLSFHHPFHFLSHLNPVPLHSHLQTSRECRWWKKQNAERKDGYSQPTGEKRSWWHWGSNNCVQPLSHASLSGPLGLYFRVILHSTGAFQPKESQS